MRAHRIMAIGWSSFLAACALEFLVFACVDPADLQGLGHWLGDSRQAPYALFFFAFWAISAVSNTVLLLLLKGEAATRDGTAQGAATGPSRGAAQD